MGKKGKSRCAARHNILKYNKKSYQKNRAAKLKSDEQEKMTKDEYYNSDNIHRRCLE